MHMYKSNIRPSLEYGNILLCNCTYTEEGELEIVQRRAMKIITSAIARTPTNNLYNELALDIKETLRKKCTFTLFQNC